MPMGQCEFYFVVPIQSLSRVWFFAAPWTAACHSTLSFTISQSFLGFMFIESVMLSNHLILCCTLLLLPSMLPTIRVFSNELALCIRWPVYQSFSLRISLSNEYSGLSSFKIDQFDLLVLKGTLKSLLQHYNSKASTLQGRAFLMVHLLHLYMTIGETIALNIWTFVGTEKSLFKYAD